MNEQQLKQFLYTAKFQNISKAAKKLYMSQQTLSQSLQNFEKELGVTLFIRTKHGVEMTEVGRKISPQSELLLNHIEDYFSFVQEQIKLNNKKTTISVEEECLLSSIPSDLMLYAASANIEFQVEKCLGSCLNALIDKSINIAYCYRPVELYNLSYIPVISEIPIVMLSEHNPLAAKESLTIADIKDEGLLLPKFNYSSFTNSLVKAYAKESAYPIFAFESPYVATLIQLVRDNVGIKLSPTYALDCFPMDGIVIRPLATTDFLVEFGFLIDSYNDLTAEELHFIDLMLEHYNTELSIISKEDK